MMTYTQHSPHTLSAQLNEDKTKKPFSMRGQLLLFYQCHSASTSYHARYDWLQHRINLGTIVTVDFQQKNHLFFNNRLVPQCVPGLSACIQYSKWCLFYCVSCFFYGNIFEHLNPIVTNKYNNQ